MQFPRDCLSPLLYHRRAHVCERGGSDCDEGENDRIRLVGLLVVSGGLDVGLLEVLEEFGVALKDDEGFIVEDVFVCL